MTQINKGENTPNRPTAAEVRTHYEANKARFDVAEAALKNLRDIQKSTRYKTISNITRESLRQYLANPSANESRLREMSRYLATRVQIYYRLLMYNASMFRLDARSVIPPFSLVEDNDPEKVKKSYNDTLKIIDKMGLQYEFFKAYFVCFMEDVFYGCRYFDENAEVYPSMFFLPLNPEYCKIQGVWNNGTFAFAMNMDYFRRNEDLLEFWGEPFTSMKKAADSSGEKWQTMPQEYSVCLKFRAEDWETIIPVFAGLFGSLIPLIELEDIQAISSEQDIYKLLIATIPTISGTNQPDDFAVDPRLAVEYFNKLLDAIPPYTDAILSPIPIDFISFNNDASTDVSKVQTATKSVLNTSGGSQILNSADMKTSAAFNAIVKADTEFAISSLLPQTEALVNYWVSLYVDTPSKVKFFEVSTYTVKDLRDELLENGQYGLSTKLAINSMSGFSELDTLSLNYLEEDVLGLSDKLVPLSSTHTQSNGKVGGQEKDVDDLTDAGMRTRDEGLDDR